MNTGSIKEVGVRSLKHILGMVLNDHNQQSVLKIFTHNPLTHSSSMWLNGKTAKGRTMGQESHLLRELTSSPK